MEQADVEELQRRKRYEFLFEGTSDMIFYFLENGKVEECNSSAYELLGFSKGEEIRMQDIFRTLAKEVDGKIVFPAGEMEPFVETTIYRKNQTCFPVQARIVLAAEETGRYGVCRATSLLQIKEADRQLVHAREEVKEAHRERNELVANVTHELRTPVNGIMGLAQNLLDTPLNGEQKETVELIDQCCKNMIKIINNILDFSKLQAGKFTIENREFHFHLMMDKIIKMNQPAVENKGLRLQCNVSEDIPDKMIGDELRLTQVLNNLLSNAIKFTNVGQVSVSVSKSLAMGDEMELFFMVTDTGIGIAPEDKDKLFKSFSQVDASITRKFGGTGLGLSIVKSLVQMMGGEINVESVKGQGSTFSFSVRVQTVQNDAPSENVPQESQFAFHFGESQEEEVNVGELFHLGSAENLKEIQLNMEKLVLCIEMENWDKADVFADKIKQLVAEDAMGLKRKAFRLQMTLRKGDHDTAMEQYKVLQDALEELKTKENMDGEE